MKNKKNLPNKLRKELDQILLDCEETRLQQLAKKKTTLPRNWVAIRDRIKKRDRDVCAGCGRKLSQDKLTVHHRDGDESNRRPGNLITLCLECHDEIPYPPFYEASFCQRMMLSDTRSVCLKLGYKAGNLTPATCPFFTAYRGCLLEYLTRGTYGIPALLSESDKKPEKSQKSATFTGKKLQGEANVS